MYNKNKICIILLFFIFIPFVESQLCPSELSLYTESESFVYGQELLVYINISPNGGFGNFWFDYNNATLNFTSNLTNTSDTFLPLLGTSIPPLSWTLNSTGLGLQTINATVFNSSNHNCTMETNVTIYNSSEPYIIITFPTIPTNFTIGQNYSFNITLNNTGLSNATNITGNITSGIGINFTFF